MMECMQKNNSMQFRMMFDAVYALAKICSFICREGIMLSDLTNEIPEIYMVEKEVECEEKSKGKVIRYITDTAESKAEKLNLTRVLK